MITIQDILSGPYRVGYCENSHGELIHTGACRVFGLYYNSSGVAGSAKLHDSTTNDNMKAFLRSKDFHAESISFGPAGILLATGLYLESSSVLNNFYATWLPA